jgi:putative transposase
MTFQPELLDELLKGYQNPEDLLEEGGILKQLTKALVERCLSAEMDTHLEEQRLCCKNRCFTGSIFSLEI